jgi:hypothetical protein
VITGNEPQIGPRPVGPVAKLSPARKGWGTDGEDCGALEARHYLHSSAAPPALGRCCGIDVPALQVLGRLTAAISPVGTAENDPGRQSWVRLTTAISPVGTAENSPGRQSWVNWTTRECYGNHPWPTRFSLRPPIESHVCHRRCESGHAENDPGTFPWLAGNFYLAAVQQHDALHDCQPEARAARDL